MSMLQILRIKFLFILLFFFSFFFFLFLFLSLFLLVLTLRFSFSLFVCLFFKTPLHKAAFGGHTEIATLLLLWGADPTISVFILFFFFWNQICFIFQKKQLNKNIVLKDACQTPESYARTRNKEETADAIRVLSLSLLSLSFPLLFISLLFSLFQFFFLRTLSFVAMSNQQRSKRKTSKKELLETNLSKWNNSIQTIESWEEKKSRKLNYSQEKMSLNRSQKLIIIEKIFGVFEPNIFILIFFLFSLFVLFREKEKESLKKGKRKRKEINFC